MNDHIKPILICDECHGLKETFEGVLMSANPSSYSDYEEVWVICEKCKGTGFILGDKNERDISQI